jgi:hypothetical protein
MEDCQNENDVRHLSCTLKRLDRALLHRRAIRAKVPDHRVAVRGIRLDRNVGDSCWQKASNGSRAGSKVDDRVGLSRLDVPPHKRRLREFASSERALNGPID